MILTDISFVCGDTSRSRCYLQALIAKNFLPSACILLPNIEQTLPGQEKNPKNSHLTTSWGKFYPNISITSLCNQYKIPTITAPNNDINNENVVELLTNLPASVYIYAGFGGTLLRKPILNCGKQFLHVHGGWLPEYKGSTTNHYSLLQENFCGASAFFLTEEIDSGNILLRKKFPAPKTPSHLDHELDPIFRSEVLLDVLSFYIQQKKWPVEQEKNKKTLPYFIMHPVLRHVLFLKGEKNAYNLQK